MPSVRSAVSRFGDFPGKNSNCIWSLRQFMYLITALHFT
jgi:hypothetical protein